MLKTLILVLMNVKNLIHLNEENLTPTSNPQSIPSSNSEHVGKKPRVSKRTSLVWNHFTIINKENSK